MSETRLDLERVLGLAAGAKVVPGPERGRVPDRGRHKGWVFEDRGGRGHNL